MWALIIIGVVLVLSILVGVLPILLRPRGSSVAEGQARYKALMEMSRERREAE